MTNNLPVSTQILFRIDAEYWAAKRQYPDWPENPFEGFAILQEEVGEAAKAILDRKHKKGSTAEILNELAQSGAMVVRLMEFFLKQKVVENVNKEISAGLDQIDRGLTADGREAFDRLRDKYYRKDIP